MNRKEAMNQEVFVINQNGEIEKTVLYDHIMLSADTTTTPSGVGSREFIEHDVVHIDKKNVLDVNKYEYDREDFDSQEEYELAIIKAHIEDLDYDYSFLRNVSKSDLKEDGNYLTLEVFYVSTWGVGGNNYRSGKFDYCFKTEDEAEDYLFDSVYKYDFETDDQRSTQWFDSIEDAEAFLSEYISEE